MLSTNSVDVGNAVNFMISGRGSFFAASSGLRFDIHDLRIESFKL